MKRDFFVILFCCLAIFFLNMDGWDLWNPDEPRYAEVAREMIVLNDFIVPHLNGEVYTDKPPLFFWLISIFLKIFGERSTFAVRLPSAIFATLTALLLYIFGKRLFGRWTGLFSSIILVTNGLYFWLARRANIDCTLTFFTTLAIFLFYLGVESERKRGTLFSFAFLFCSLAFLTKLQIAIIVPALAMISYLLTTRKFHIFKDWRLYVCMIYFVLPIVAWILPAYILQGKTYIGELFYLKTTAKFFEEVSHVRPFYYYFLNFPMDFLPWFFFFPSALILTFRAYKRRDEKLVFLLCWFVANFIFFSISKGKRELYLLPIFPSACILVGYLWQRYVSSDDPFTEKLVRIPVALLSGFFLVVAVAIPLIVKLNFGFYLAGNIVFIIILSSIFLVGSICLFFEKEKKSQFFLISATTALIFIFSVLFVFPSLNEFKSAKKMSEDIVKIVRSPEKIAFFEMEGAQFNFYTGFINLRRLNGKREMKDYLKTNETVFCIVEKHKMYSMKDEVKFYPVLSYSIGSKEYLLISNKEKR